MSVPSQPASEHARRVNEPGGLYHGTGVLFPVGGRILPASSTGHPGFFRDADRSVVYCTHRLDQAWFFARHAAEQLETVPHVYLVVPVGPRPSPTWPEHELLAGAAIVLAEVTEQAQAAAELIAAAWPPHQT